MSWRYFERDEFKCKCGCGRNLIDHAFVTRLDNLRAEYGKPLRITSGYRCPEHNSRVSSTGRGGPHTTGMAADIGVSRGDAYHVLQLALEHGFTGIGVNQKGDGRFLHLDDLRTPPRPTVWSY